jgi:hypothetical protein
MSSSAKSKVVTKIPRNESYNTALTWSSAATITFAELAEVKEADLTKFLKVIGPLWTMEEVDLEMIDKFLYDGFDYKTLQKSLAAIVLKSNMSPEDFKDNLSKALAIHHVTGNITSKRFASLKGPGKEIVNSVNTALNIRMGKKSGLSRADITYPRLGALFPFPLSVIGNKYPKDFASKYDTTQLPDYMKTSSFASLIPSSQPYTNLLKMAYLSYSVDMTVAISGKDYLSMKQEELDSILAKQRKFVEMSYNSGVVDQMSRVRAMRALRVDNEDTYKRLSTVAGNFGYKDYPSFSDWNKALVNSYAEYKDSAGAVLLPLAGAALEKVGERKKEPMPDPDPQASPVAGPSSF